MLLLPWLWFVCGSWIRLLLAVALALALFAFGGAGDNLVMSLLN